MEATRIVRRTLLSFVVAVQAFALSTVSDTYKYPDGATPTGTCTIRWPSFTATGGTRIAEGKKDFSVMAGVFSISLEPTDTAVTTGVTYAVTCRFNRGSIAETWVVPTSGSTLTLSQVVTTSAGSVGPTINFSLITGMSLGSLLYGNSSGVATLRSIGTAGQVLTVSGGLPAWADATGGSAHAILSATHTDSTAAAVLRGAIITGQGASPTWTRLTLGALGRYLKSDGTDIVYSSGAASGTGACVASSWASTLNADAAPTCTQPGFSDLSGSIADGQIPASITRDSEINVQGGAGLTSTGAGVSPTLSTASGESDFLASGALTCGAATQGKAQVHTTPLQYCDNAATPTLRYTAYADLNGNATAGDSATAFFGAGQIESARGGTGDDTSATSGIPRISVGNWTYDAGLSHLASSSSADLRGVLSDENGTGVALFDSSTSATLATPAITGKVDRNNTAVDDDDCTGEQGLGWFDTTDGAFEWCNANSGAPAVPIVPDAGAANNFVTAISGIGVISKAQPSFSNLSGTATDSQLSQKAAGYPIQFVASNTATVADATTYYGGCFLLSLTTNNANRRCYIQQAGTVRIARLSFLQSAGTAETSTVSFRLNDTTDTTISASVTNDAAFTTFVNSGLSIAVAANDYFEIKWVSPTWVTNPTNISVSGMIWVE